MIASFKGAYKFVPQIDPKWWIKDALIVIYTIELPSSFYIRSISLMTCTSKYVLVSISARSAFAT